MTENSSCTQNVRLAAGAWRFCTGLLTTAPAFLPYMTTNVLFWYSNSWLES